MREFWGLSVGLMALAGCSTVPQPISDRQAQDAAVSLRTEISQHADPLTQPLTLYEAMARALKYNLEHRVAMMEIDVARADYTLSRYNRLPDVVAHAGSFSRNNQAGSSSLSLISGRQSLEPSTATEKSYRTGDLTTHWNSLDFGLSKIRSEQLADETLIYEERRRKAVSRIIGDVRRAYGRALSAQRLTQRLLSLEEDVRLAMDGSRALFGARKAAPMPALAYQRELNDIQAELQRLTRDVSGAKVELAGLMGTAPHQSFTLQALDDDAGDSAPQALVIDYEAMFDLALQQRPEVRETIYAKRIGDKEMKKVVLETLPSLEAFAGLKVNSNDFLYHSNWADYGARASWNLMKVFSLSARKREAKARASLDQQRGLAAAIAVMTQLAMACTRYESVREAYLIADQGADIQADILMQIEALFKAGSISRQSLVRERLNSLVSDSHRDRLKAEMKDAAAQIYASMGFDPYGADIQGHEDVAIITASLEAHWAARKNLPEI